MASMAAEHHARRGQRLLEVGEWKAAEQAFSTALWEARSNPTPELLAGRAAALLRCPGDWEQKLDALQSANARGLVSPQFWALSVRGYLKILDVLDGRDAELSAQSQRRLTSVRESVADLVCQATRVFQNYVGDGDTQAWPWGAALVAIGDWLYDFQGIEAGEHGRYPYREIAQTLYRPVAECDLGSIYDDPEIRAEIDLRVTHRARRQMQKFGPAPRTAAKARVSSAHPEWSLFALRSL